MRSVIGAYVMKATLFAAIGAVVEVTTRERGPGDGESSSVTRQRLVQSGTSYLSQNDFTRHFGLGDAETYDAIEVRWPDGTTSKHAGGEADRLVVIRKPVPEKAEPQR